MTEKNKKPAGRLKAVVGAKGGGKSGSSQQSPTEQPDSLRSRAYANIIDVVSEGQIKGLVNGLKSVYFDNVALQNADGTYNFEDVKVDFRDGSIGQPYLNTGSGIESTTDVSTTLIYNTPVVRSIISSDADLCRVAINVGALKKTNTTNGNVTGSSVSHLIEYRSNGGAWSTVKTDVITGKTSSGYQRDVSFRLAGIAPWDVRVTRLTANSTSDALQNATSWANLTSVMEEKLRYPGTALFGLQVNAEQFSGIPTRAYLLDGLIIKVPSNYNPTTRVYKGAWNGTFKMAWTDNPAWCLYDLLTNERYGLGSRIDAGMLDKWELYEIGRYCDQLVPDGHGGTEPRFTCNLYLQARSEAYKAIQDMTTIFRGISYWASGSIAVAQDSPKSVRYQFNNSNVEGGIFERAGSNIKTRHNVALVTWNDPSDMYRQNIEYVEDFAAIEKMGYVSESEVVSFGCTSQGQARRYGEWLLYTELNESEVMTFTTGAEGAIPMPNDIIQVSDVYRAGERRGGRVLSGSTKSSIKLDSSVVLAVGKTYSLSIIDVDGGFQSKTVSSAAGTRSTVAVSTAFTKAVAENSTWILSDADLQPETLRVVGVEEVEAGKYKIGCLSHNPSKFDYIERNQTLQTPKTSNLSTIKPDVTNVVIAEEKYTGSGEIPMSRIAVSFQPANAASTAFFVEYKVGSGAWAKTATTSQHYAEIPFTAEGETYTIRVVAGNRLLGIWNSSPTEYTFTPAAYAVPAVTGLATATAWSTGKSIVLSWDELKGIPTFDLDVMAGGLFVRSVNVKGNSFVYTPQDMKSDGGYWRTITFRVRARSSLGRTGAWASLACTNEQIGALQGLSIQSGIRQAFLTFDKPADLDYAGVCVWVGTTASFAASDANKVFDGMTSLVNLTSLTDNSPLLPNVTYYLRAAGYDEFGKDGLAVSASMAFVVNGVVAEINSVAANMLEATLSSTIGLITAPASTSGSVNARVGSLSTASSTAVSAAQAAVSSLSTAAAAAVSNEATARVNAVLAEANRAATAEAQLSTSTSTLAAATSTSLASNAAAIQAEASTRSTETGALTTQLNTLAAQTQSIKSSQTFAIVGDGLDIARWGGSSLLSVLSDASAYGGYVLHVGDNLGNDHANIILDDKIKITDDVLKVTVRWRRVSGAGGVFVSLRVFNEGGEFIINQHGKSNLKPALGEWQTTVVYYKRGALVGALGESASDPKGLDAGGFYVKPYLIFNYSLASGECELDYYSVEMIPSTSISLIDDERTARTDGDAANATNIATLSAAVNSNKTSADAGIATAQTATASLSTATATNAAALTATVSTNKAATDGSITALSTLVVNGDAANASTINALSTSTNTKTASLSTSVLGLSTAVTTADTALGTRIDGVTAAVNTTAASLSTSVYTAQTATASLSTATANSLASLTATVSTNKTSSDAAVLTAQTATASLSTATAGSITTLSTTVSTKTTSLSTSVVTAKAATSSLSTATATSITNLTATVSTNKSTAAAGVLASQNAVASLSTATANTLTTLTATVSTNKTSTDASIVTAQGAVASLSTATVSSMTFLQARLLTRPNLLPNGGFENGLTNWEGMSGWEVSDHPTFGRAATAVKSGTGSFRSSAIPCEPNVRYTWTGDVALAATSGTCGFDLIFFDESGALLSSTAKASPSAPFGFSAGGRDVFQMSVITPATAATMKVRFGYANVVGCTYMGVRQVKIEQGDLPATPYTSEGSGAQSFAGILSVQAATASLSTATANSVATLQTSLNGNTASIQTQQTSINGLSAQWAVKTDVNGYVAGFGLATTANNGTPTSAFVIRADAFGVGSPGQATSYVFVIDTAKNRVGLNGTLLVDGTVAATAIVANSITAAQLAVKAVTADKIDVTNLSAISATLGNVSGGSFFGGSHTSSYTWPASGGGFHLSAAGLLLGNANTGKYFQVNSDGNMYAPGMKIENGVMTINQINVIDTSNIVNNAVTKVTSISSDAVAEVLTNPSRSETTVINLVVVATRSAKLNIWSTFELSDVGLGTTYTENYTENSGYYRLLVDGVELISRDTVVTVGKYTQYSALDVVDVGAGSHTVQILANGDYHYPSTSTMRSRYRRMVCLLSYK